MKIKLGDNHYLNSDAGCYWISRMVKQKKNEKMVERRVSGYVATFNQAVTSYIEGKLRTSEATEVAELRDEIEHIKQTVMSWTIDMEK